jgi:hypothetical protein
VGCNPSKIEKFHRRIKPPAAMPVTTLKAIMIALHHEEGH